MVKFKHRALITFCVICLGYLSFSQSAHASNLWAVVNSNQVTQAEVFQLRVILDEKVDSDEIDFTVLEKDFFLGQPSFASALNFTNGKRSSTSEWTLALKARTTGQLVIPSFEVNGSQSQAITITVSADTNLPDQKDLAEIESTLSRTTLYPYESAELKTRLIIKADVRRLQNPNFFAPSAQSNQPGITVSEKGKANQYNRVINGVDVTIIDQVFTVTAEQSGHYTLNSLGFSATVVHGNSRTGTTKLIPIELIPEQFAIEVKEKPATVTTPWIPSKQVTLQQRWLTADGEPLVPDALTQTTPTLNVGDALTREITLEIDGLTPEHFPRLETQYPSALRQYAEKPQYRQQPNGQYLMTLKQVLIAQQVGKVELPAIDLAWWNTQKDQKELSALQGLAIEIKPADVSNTPIAVPVEPSKPAVVYQSGYWPYLTALFALLWISTLAWHLKAGARKADQNKTVAHTETSDLTQMLMSAVSQSDSAKIQHLVPRWLIEQNGKDSALIEQIQAEVAAMNRHLYSHEQTKWDNRQLLTLIKKLSQSRLIKAQANVELPKL